MAFQTTQRPAFGRRIDPQAQPAAPVRVARTTGPAVAAPAGPSAEAAVDAGDISVDQEVQAWKEARGSQFKMPWRQVYLTASLCFGIASFVLPDSVNDSVDYLLWGLCAMSVYAWYTGRKKNTEIKDSAAP